MDEENEASMLIDPEILQKELVISLPILSESDIEMMINGVDSSFDDSSSSSIDNEKEKPCLKRDQRRLNLLNNPNYGIILSFMEKFRSYIDLKNYPLRIFEDNLINEKEKISGRFIDFHHTLLKKITPGKIAERDQFVSNMTKLAYRFNRDDGDHLSEYGYSKARIDTKLRILKNLLEQQFDRNPTLKTAIADKPSLEIRSKPFGRDRFGALYWLFTDTDCFIRLFRENIDANRTWTNLAKNPQELENLIKILITDSVVRKKFPEWKFSYESFNNLSPSNKFEEDYAPDFVDIKEKNQTKEEIRPSFALFGSSFIKTKDVDLDPVVNLNRDFPSPPPSLSSPFLINNAQIENILDTTSDEGSINSEEIKANRSRISSSSPSNDTRDDIFSRGSSQESNEKEQHQKSTNNNNNTAVIVLQQGIKRKLVDYDDTESEIDSEKNVEVSQNLHQTSMNKESKTNNTDLPIALRRPRRGGRSSIADLSADSWSTSNSTSDDSIKKKNIDGKRKGSNRSSKTNSRRQHRRRGGKKSSEFSSTTSDERQQSDEDDFSETYSPNNTESDKILNGDLPDEDDDDDDHIPRRKAKTVAQCPELCQVQLKPCSICSQTDRPELLLLCEDCSDAYHLECIKPELLSIPDDDWYCSLCEHKRLCDGLIEKFIILLNDEKDFEMRRRLYVSKRRKRLTNVTVNLDRYVREPTDDKQPIKKIVSSDDEKESEKKANSTNDDDDVDSVYGRKNDENRKPFEQEEEEPEQPGKRRVRSCRRKAQNYSLDDYDKKIKEAMIDAGINKELIENDSDDSEHFIFKKKSTKKRPRYEEDDDFDISKGKDGDDDFVPSRRRSTKGDSRIMNDDSRIMNDDSRTMTGGSRSDYNDYEDFGMSDDDNAWRDRRQSSTSSISKQKKSSKPKSNRSNQRKPPIVSDDDTILYDPDEHSLSPVLNIKSEPRTEFDQNELTNDVFPKNEIVKNVYDKNKIVENVVYINEAANINKPKRPPRKSAPKKPKKKPIIQDENVSDDDAKPRPTPAKRQPGYKWRDANESDPDDDDDYEKAAHKRQLFNRGKNITRTSITKHIKKLVGDEDDDEEEEEGEENGDGTKKDDNNNSEKKNQNPQYDAPRLSDDDDFPDEQEILKTTGLINVKKPPNGQKAAPLRIPFMPSMQSYQFAMVDPTAQFEFTCLPEPPMTEPSDANQANGDTNLSTTT